MNPDVKYGVRLPLWANFTLTPSARVRYVADFVGGYTEAGTTVPLTVQAHTLQALEERGELQFAQTIQFAPRETLTWSVRAGVLGQQQVGDRAIDFVVLGVPLPAIPPGKTNASGGFGGFGFDVRSKNVSWFVSAEYTAYSYSSTLVTLTGGLRVVF